MGYPQYNEADMRKAFQAGGARARWDQLDDEGYVLDREAYPQPPDFEAWLKENG